jgi:hypothetical protein
MSLGKPEVLALPRDVLEVRIMELEVENSRLQQLVAELLLKNQQLRDTHLPNQRDSGKFDRNRSRPHAKRFLLDPHPVSKSEES